MARGLGKTLVGYPDQDGKGHLVGEGEHAWGPGDWNPLIDDGDALRLAAQLRLEIYIHENDTRVVSGNLASASQEHGDDVLAATRRAIVRTAAAIVLDKVLP
ncbi:hypothetical protein D3C78_1410600 [compost metagenome]